MENYKPNSFKYREEQKQKEQDHERVQQQKVVSGTVKTHKKSGVQKFAESFIAEDAHRVKDYVTTDILIPSLKKLALDVIKNTADIIFNGYSNSNRSNLPGSKVSYGSYFRPEERNGFRQSAPRVTFDYDNIVLENRGDAEMVLTQLDEIISRFGCARVADLYDMVGMSCKYTDNNYGWYDLRTASILRVQDGFLLKLPRPTDIRR